MGKAECEYVGVPYEEVLKLKKLLDKAGKQANKLGVYIFGGCGSGTIRKTDYHNRPLILETVLYGCWDGGDGRELVTEDGYTVGECESYDD